jgi:hypothetical protein
MLLTQMWTGTLFIYPFLDAWLITKLFFLKSGSSNVGIKTQLQTGHRVLTDAQQTNLLWGAVSEIRIYAMWHRIPPENYYRSYGGT